MTDEQLLTARQAAAYLGVHPTHLYDLVKDGLPSYDLGRRDRAALRFRREEIDAWLKTRRNHR